MSISSEKLTVRSKQKQQPDKKMKTSIASNRRHLNTGSPTPPTASRGRCEWQKTLPLRGDELRPIVCQVADEHHVAIRTCRTLEGCAPATIVNIQGRRSNIDSAVMALGLMALSTLATMRVG